MFSHHLQAQRVVARKHCIVVKQCCFILIIRSLFPHISYSPIVHPVAPATLMPSDLLTPYGFRARRRCRRCPRLGSLNCTRRRHRRRRHGALCGERSTPRPSHHPCSPPPPLRAGTQEVRQGRRDLLRAARCRRCQRSRARPRFARRTPRARRRRGMKRSCRASGLTFRCRYGEGVR